MTSARTGWAEENNSAWSRAHRSFQSPNGSQLSPFLPGRKTSRSVVKMKSERIEKASPSTPLTEDQKQEIAEVDSVYRAKIAEREVFLKDQIRKAQTTGKPEEAQSIEKQLASEMRRLQEECEAKKEKLRASFTG